MQKHKGLAYSYKMVTNIAFSISLTFLSASYTVSAGRSKGIGYMGGSKGTRKVEALTSGERR